MTYFITAVNDISLKINTDLSRTRPFKPRPRRDVLSPRQDRDRDVAAPETLARRTVNTNVDQCHNIGILGDHVSVFLSFTRYIFETEIKKKQLLV